VLENVLVPMHHTGTYKGQRRQRALELLELVEVPETSKYPSQLSGGQQQRAAIARAWNSSRAAVLRRNKGDKRNEHHPPG
jgi:ABC-type methionine transport system ATPase subunit